MKEVLIGDVGGGESRSRYTLRDLCTDTYRGLPGKGGKKPREHPLNGVVTSNRKLDQVLEVGQNVSDSLMGSSESNLK